MLEKKTKRKGSNPILMLLAFLLVCAHTFAQPNERKITGRVTDANTGLPVAGASVAVKGGQNAVTSDADGVFSITAKTGQTLDITAIGHISKSLKVDAETNAFAIQLDQSYAKLDDVVVV